MARSILRDLNSSPLAEEDKALFRFVGKMNRAVSPMKAQLPHSPVEICAFSPFRNWISLTATKGFSNAIETHGKLREKILDWSSSTDVS
jgi:hypothetical protein